MVSGQIGDSFWFGACDLKRVWFCITIVSVMDLHAIDRKFISLARKVFVPVARISLFIIFFYFGLLKVVGVSPADPLVEALLEKTLFFIDPDSFFIFLGCVEMLIGILFLIPNGKVTRVAFVIFIIQMSTTLLPLVMLPYITWAAPFVPTLEGQYIIKNLVLIALAVGLVSQLSPLSTTKK